MTRDTRTKGQRIHLAYVTPQGKGNDNTPSFRMHYTPYTQGTRITRRALSNLSNQTQVNQPISTQHNTRVTTGREPKKLLRRVQLRPSAQGREGLLRMGGGRADQVASSFGREQHVALENTGWYDAPPFKYSLRTLWTLRVIGVSMCRDWGRRHGRSGSTAIRWWLLVCTRGWRRGHIWSGS